jgi:hypothetical protein
MKGKSQSKEVNKTYKLLVIHVSEKTILAWFRFLGTSSSSPPLLYASTIVVMQATPVE